MKRTQQNRSMGISGRAAVRRIRAARRLPKAKRALSVTLAVLAVLVPAILLVSLLLKVGAAGFSVLFWVCAAFFGAALLSLLSVALASALLAPLRTDSGKEGLLTDYMRAYLAEALASDRERLLAREGGDALLTDLLRYAEHFRLTHSEYEALASAPDIDAASERIAAPYLALLSYLSEATDAERLRYLAVREEARAVIKAWCHRVFPRRAAVHYPLLTRNMELVARTVADAHHAFACGEVERLLRPFLLDAILYHEYEREGARLLLPTRARHKAFRLLVERLCHFPAHGLAVGEGGRRLEEYRALLDEYDAYAARYTLSGCTTVDSEGCRRRYREAIEDADRCYSCGLDYGDRHRAVCRRCGHYICPDCGACYCGKVISHDMSRATVRYD